MLLKKRCGEDQVVCIVDVISGRVFSNLGYEMQLFGLSLFLEPMDYFLDKKAC